MTLIIVLMSMLVMLCGGLAAATPWFMPPTECFAVTVPPSAQDDPRIKGYRRSYTLITCVVTLACGLGTALMLSWLLPENPTDAKAAALVSTLITLATIVPLVVSFGLMLHYRSRVRALKQSEHWTASAQQAVTLVGEDIPEPISLAWNLLYVPLTLGMIAFALAWYDRFPEQIPMNFDFSGNVTSSVPKSIGSVLFPAITVGYMGVVFAICHWMTIISKRPIDPAAPATSALAYGRFARVQSQMMLVGGLLLSLGIGIMFYLSALDIIPGSIAAGGLMAVTILFVIAVAIVSLRFGQSGGRLAAELRTNDELAADDDEHWILGSFYYNPDDASIMVPKRFGIGWTVNCASRAAWAIMVGVVVVTVAFTLLVNMLVG